MILVDVSLQGVFVTDSYVCSVIRFCLSYVHRTWVSSQDVFWFAKITTYASNY